MIKPFVKDIRNRAVSLLAPHRWSKPRASLLVLTYHRVLPETFSDADIVEPGMYVSEATFSSHLEALKADFELVDLSEWIQKREQGVAMPQRCCAITFDDGWRDNYDFAYPLLQQHGVPATVFVVASMIGTTRQFWPERLARLLARTDIDLTNCDEPAKGWLINLLQESSVAASRLSPRDISAVIHSAKRFTDNEIHGLLDQIAASADSDAVAEHRDLLDWRELREMADSGLVSVGSHTASHIRLVGGLSADVLGSEIVGSKSLIEQHLESPATLFCYPNGDVDETSEALVRETYNGACTTQTGWNRPDQDAFRLRRYTMHEGNSADAAAFRAKISGWF